MGDFSASLTTILTHREMEYAKWYLDGLINGVNPLNGQQNPREDTVRQSGIKNCLIYVSDILGKVIANDGVVVKYPHKKASPGKGKAAFALTNEQLSRFPYNMDKRTISDIVGCLNALIDKETMEKLSRRKLQNVLVEDGLLKTVMIHGREHKIPTEKGKTLGITTEQREGASGSYHVNIYDINTQKYVIGKINVFASRCI